MVGRYKKQVFLYRVKNMLAMYLKYHKAGLTPTTPVTSIAISPVKMSIGRKSLTIITFPELFFLNFSGMFRKAMIKPENDRKAEICRT
jgi:hypothetical protein